MLCVIAGVGEFDPVGVKVEDLEGGTLLEIDFTAVMEAVMVGDSVFEGDSVAEIETDRDILMVELGV